MEKLMKPAEYAKELGISRQAVYAKIKRGILTAKSVDGKLYIVVDSDAVAEEMTETPQRQEEKPVTETVKPARSSSAKDKDYEALLAAKDETIAVLKGTVKDLKKSNKQITTTLRGEIDLLKEAFHEMRTLYMHQIEYRGSEPDAIDVESETREPVWGGVKKFFKAAGITKPRQQEKLLKRFKKAWKAGDARICKIDGKLKVDLSENYDDLVG